MEKDHKCNFTFYIVHTYIVKSGPWAYRNMTSDSYGIPALWCISNVNEWATKLLVLYISEWASRSDNESGSEMTHELAAGRLRKPYEKLSRLEKKGMFSNCHFNND